MKKWLLIIAAVALYQNWGKLERAIKGPPQFSGGEVVLYSTVQCGYCTLTRKLLDEHGIAYAERDIDRSRSAFDEMMRLTGRNAVPVLVVNQRVLQGYNKAAMLAALYD